MATWLKLLVCAVFIGAESCLMFSSWGEEAQKPDRRQTVKSIEAEIQASLKNIPWNDLSVKAKNKIKRVVFNQPLYRKLPQQAVYADPELYQFLLTHPDMVIGFWERFGATQISLREISEDHFVMKEVTGTTAVAEILYRTKDLCIVYAKGEYRGPFLVKPYSGEVVLLLRTRVGRDEDNESMIVSNLDAFVHIDNTGADILAKLFSTSLGKIADSNFEQSVLFVAQLSRASVVKPESIKQYAEQITTVQADVCKDFTDVVDRIAMRFHRRTTAALIERHTAAMKAAEREPETFPTEIALKKDLFDSDPFFAKPYEAVHRQVEPVSIEESEMETETAELTVVVEEPVSTKKRAAVFGTPKIAKQPDSP